MTHSVQCRDPNSTADERLAPTSRLRHAGAWTRAVFWFASAGYLIVVAWVGRFPNWDETFYKAAGRAWALRGTFAAPEIIGRLPFEPPIDKIFAAYPPLYPFAFGVWTKLFGFGWRQVALFDACIHVGLALMTARFVVCLAPTLPSVVRYAAALLILVPCGTATIGRPDELAMIFMLVAVCLYRERRTSLGIVGAGVAWGLCAATSVGAAALLGLACAPVLLTQSNGTDVGSARLNAARWLKDAAVLATAAALTFGLCWLPILLAEPRAWHQFVDHVSGDVRPPGGYLDQVKSTLIYGKFTLFPLAGSMIALACAWTIRTRAERRVARSTETAAVHGSAPIRSLQLAAWSVVPVAAVFFSLVTRPWKFTYAWFCGPILIAVACVVLASTWRAGKVRAMAIAASGLVLVGSVTLAAVPWALETISLVTAPPDQGWAAAERVLRDVVPDGATVLAIEHWSVLAGRCEVVYDAKFCGDDRIDHVNWIVFSGFRSGAPGRRGRMRDAWEIALQRDFVLVHDSLLRERFKLFGHPISNSSWGLGPMVFKREQVAVGAKRG